MAGVHAIAGSKRAVSVVVVMNPASPQFSTGSTVSKDFVQSVDVTGGTPTSYVWSVNDTSGHTWSIQGGQGTSSATVRVTGVISGGSATADVSVDVVVGGVTYSLSNSLNYGRS